MASGLTAAIELVARGIGDGGFRSEAEISQGVVKRLLHELGWPVFDVRVVAPEYRIGKRMVGYALCHPPGKPAVLVEVKDLGKADSRGEKQLFEYCFHQGVPVALLTDGRIWNFFFPAGQGSYDDRRFGQVDLVEDEATACGQVLARYLHFDHVKSGAGRKHAEQDYDTTRSEREAATNYDAAWNRLLSGPDSRLLDLFRGEVERVSGVRPSRDWAAKFLQRQNRRREAGPARSRSGRSKQIPTKSASDGPTAADQRTSGRFWYQFGGQRESFRSGVELIVAVFDKLAAHHPTLLERYSTKHRGRTRRYVARTRDDLYDIPEMRKHGKRMKCGWWIDTNCSNAQKESRIKKACKIVGIRYGQDLIVGPIERRETP